MSSMVTNRTLRGRPSGEPLFKIVGGGAADRARARVEQLYERKKELEEELGGFSSANDDEREAAELLREVAELEQAVEAERTSSAAERTAKRRDGMDPVKELEAIEKAMVHGTADPARLRKAAEDVYDEVVSRIAKAEGCSTWRAHRLASKDPIGKRAYAQVVELQDRASHAFVG